MKEGCAFEVKLVPTKTTIQFFSVSVCLVTTGLFLELGILFRVLLGFQGSKQEALEKLSEKIGRKFLQIH